MTGHTWHLHAIELDSDGVVPVIWSISEPYWWRRRRGYVLWPLVIGIAFCALCLWSGLVFEHNQADFRAHAVRTRAVIQKILTSAPSQGDSVPTFDEYALVHFAALGKQGQARILVASGCTGTCVPDYHVDQVLTVYYDPANRRFAQLPAQVHGPSGTVLSGLLMLGLLGLASLGAAVVNMKTA